MNPPVKLTPEFVPIRPVVALSLPQINGSIFQVGQGLDLFSDASAKRIGDIITVVLQEKTNAKKSASTKTSKASTLDTAVPNLLGGIVTMFDQSILTNELKADRDFSGKGDSTQSNSLTGNITVVVAEVLANGHLVVQGEKRITLNQGGEYLQFSGIVRPTDIRPDNTVVSSSVANVQIIYSGTGAVADANTQGWLTRFFHSPWWPF